MANYPFWIKERHNPQLGIYYVACGKMSKTKARKMEDGGYGYGFNVMLEYKTEHEYNSALADLKARGESVQ